MFITTMIYNVNNKMNVILVSLQKENIEIVPKI